MPITYWTSLLGTLALIGFPGFSGFYSKDALIEAVSESHLPAAGYAYWCVLLGVFVTALYSFRMFFLVFHGKERMDAETRSHLHETSWVVTLPLILLAIPSVIIGWFTIAPLLFGGFFGTAIVVLPGHDVLAEVGTHFHGPAAFLVHGLSSPAVWLAGGGFVTAWYLYMRRPELALTMSQRFAPAHKVLSNKYYFDEFYQNVIAGGGRLLGRMLWRVGDVTLIDGLLVNGTARSIGWFSGVIRQVQTGYLYHYAFAMIIGLAALLGWYLWRT